MSCLLKNDLKSISFYSIYESFDVFLDTVQHLPSVKNNPRNQNKDKRFTLSQPEEYVEFAEQLIGELNDRLTDTNYEFHDF